MVLLKKFEDSEEVNMQEASRNVENKERPRRPKKEYNNNNSDRKPYVRRDQQAPAAGSSDLAAKKTSELRDLAKKRMFLDMKP